MWVRCLPLLAHPDTLRDLQRFPFRCVRLQVWCGPGPASPCLWVFMQTAVSTYRYGFATAHFLHAIALCPLPWHYLSSPRKGWASNERKNKIKDDNIIFFLWVSFEVREHTRGFYTTWRETQLFAYTTSGMTIFVSQSHISSVGICQGSSHAIHCSQLDATNCPTTILRNSLFCFSNLENKGVLQAVLTGKSYIFNTKEKGKEKKEVSPSYSRRLPLSSQSALSAWPPSSHFSTPAENKWNLYCLCFSDKDNIWQFVACKERASGY